MDAEPASTGRYFNVSGASKLAAIADRAVDLQVYPDMPRGRSHFVAWDGQTAVVNDAAEAADTLSHVFVL